MQILSFQCFSSKLNFFTAYKRANTFWSCFLISAIWLFLSAQIHAQPVIQWDKTYGGIYDDYLRSSKQTADGGYILAGQSNSSLGGDKSQPSNGSTDYWVVKLASDGTKEWDKSYGGSYIDILKYVLQTSDGGYILAGDSYSGISGDKSEGNGGSDNGEDQQPDFWIVKVSANGTKEWDKTFLREGEELLSRIGPTSDGGYIAWGTYYLVKFSASGAKEWDRAFTSGIGLDQAGNFETPDGGYIVGGTASNGYNVIKLTANGAIEWDNVYTGAQGFGSPSNQVAIITMAPDGGYIIGGSANYNIGGDKTDPTRGGYDYWILKIASDGSKVWDKAFGGSGNDYLRSIHRISNGGYLLGGISYSGIDGDKSGALSGEYDAWMIKITEEGTKEWDNSLGGTGRNQLSLLQEGPSGSYLLSGSTFGLATEDKTSDVSGAWMIKLAQDGTEIWDKTIGQMDGVSFVAPTVDGGYLVSGSSNANAGGMKSDNSKGGLDYWVIKVTPDNSLPVTLTVFDSKKEGNTALLEWSTTFETRSDHFDVQHSLDGKSWKTVANINAKGESEMVSNYKYVHNNPVLGSENLYRLKMIDTDGTFAYSKINSLTFDSDLSLNMYPNPVSEILTIKMADWKNVTEVQLINSQSAIVYNSAKSPKKEFNVSRFLPGLYLLKITKSDGSSLSHKVVVAR